MSSTRSHASETGNAFPQGYAFLPIPGLDNDTSAKLAAAQTELAWQVDGLTKLHALAEKLTCTPEVDEALQAILDTVVSICGADYGLLTVHDGNSGRLNPGASVGFNDVALQMLQFIDPQMEGGCCGRSFTTLSRVVVEDATLDPVFEGLENLIYEVGFRSVHSTPVLTRSGEPLGVLSVHFQQVRRPAQRELQMMDVCARYAASALEALRTQQALRAAHDDLELRVKERTQQLRDLALELTQTEERERKRLARELHDNIQQLLVAIKMQASYAQTQPQPALTEVIALSEEAIAACRALVVGISPPVLMDAEFGEALKWLARRMLELHGLWVHVQVNEAPPRPSEEERSLLFDGVRELLLNIVKHAGVHEATVTLGIQDNQMLIEVEDEGVGCHAALLEEGGMDSFGLFSLRERLSVLGGGLSIFSAPGQGCRAQLWLPMTEAGPPESQPRGRRRPASMDKRGKLLRVLLVDDHEIVRQGMFQLLSSQPDMEVVGQASTGVEGLELARTLRPDLILMDISMPLMNGIEATRLICAELPEVRVIGLSMHESEEMAKAMRDAGARAFVNKSDAIDKLMTAIHGLG